MMNKGNRRGKSATTTSKLRFDIKDSNWPFGTAEIPELIKES
jgi:hypothetical protein